MREIREDLEHSAGVVKYVIVKLLRGIIGGQRVEYALNERGLAAALIAYDKKIAAVAEVEIQGELLLITRIVQKPEICTNDSILFIILLCVNFFKLYFLRESGLP